MELDWIENVVRAKKPSRVPIVLTRREVEMVLSRMKERYWLMASLIYGTGLRVMECLRLRVQDLDFGYRQILVRNGKGGKDRFVPLPDSLAVPLQQQIAEAKRLRDADYHEISLPDTLARKYPNAPLEIGW